MSKSILFILTIWVSATLYAHPDINNRIENISSLINQSPTNGQLLIKRGLLHQEHQNWQLASKDFERAQTLGIVTAWVSFYRAGVFRDTNQNKKAEALLLHSLNESKNVKDKQSLVSMVHLNLAELNATKKQWLSAANHYLLSIGALNTQNPGIYLACSKAFEKAGPEYYKFAINILEQGIIQFPGVISLYEMAIKIEVERKKIKSAIFILEKLLDKYPKLESKQKQLEELRHETKN